MIIKKSAFFSDEKSFREFTRDQKSIGARANAKSEQFFTQSADFTSRPTSAMREKKTPLALALEMLLDMKLSIDCSNLIAPTLNLIGFNIKPAKIKDKVNLDDYRFTLVSNNGIKRLLLQMPDRILKNPSIENQSALTFVKNIFHQADEYSPPINLFIFYHEKPAPVYRHWMSLWTNRGDFNIKLVSIKEILGLQDKEQEVFMQDLKEILELESPLEITYLPHPQIRKLTDAIRTGELLPDRDALLAGINRGYVAALPMRRNTLDQIESDLVAMNGVPYLTGYEVPLKTWLENVVHKLRARGRSEQALFQEALNDVAAKSEDIIREAQGIVPITSETEESSARGWRKYKEWKKIHYFTDGKSLCGYIRSQSAITKSVYVNDESPYDKCISCMKKLKK